MDNTGYIIIHGYAGGLYEIKYLEDFLKSKGLFAYSILLSGHGIDRKELSKYNYNEWINSARQQIKEIAKIHEKLVFIGFSMGGLVCVNLVKEFNVSMFITINTPIYFWNVKLIIKNILNGVLTKNFNKISYYFKSSKNSTFRSVINFLLILNKSKRLFTNVSCRTLILQCLDDDAVRSKSAKYIKTKIGETSYVKYYDSGTHLVLLSNTKDEVCNDIYEFIMDMSEIIK